MANTNGPGNVPDGRDQHNGASASRDEGLERRRRDLGAKLATRRSETQSGASDARSREATGYGQAMRLSSEFIAGIVVGVGLGWIIDYAAGTSPWALIICLLLGFGAGVLNVLRSAGVVAEVGLGAPGKKPEDRN